ncbi:hypothetical protein [Streptomyces sp. NPDC020362]|uniref:hypothetical protein n=1 Tax=unclassified Streptomyces TaxID=2593676 RepID=UPI0033EB80C9
MNRVIRVCRVKPVIRVFSVKPVMRVFSVKPVMRVCRVKPVIRVCRVKPGDTGGKREAGVDGVDAHHGGVIQRQGAV